MQIVSFQEHTILDLNLEICHFSRRKLFKNPLKQPKQQKELKNHLLNGGFDYLNSNILARFQNLQEREN
jgi:hypothetical protein